MNESLLNTCQGMVPEHHEIVLPGTPSLRAFFHSEEFRAEVCSKLTTQYEIDLTVRDDAQSIEDTENMTEERLLFQYTRNNAGGLKDAIDFLILKLVPHGLDAATVKGAISRPKSDSFETSLPFFNSAVLQPALSTDSPTRSTFSLDEVSERGSIFDKLRKPGSISSISSFLDRRKNHSSSSNSLFKHASSNASKASLISMESRDSGYRSIWNDSGVNLPDDDAHSLHSLHTPGWPSRYELKPNQSTTSIPAFPFPSTVLPGDSTPKHEARPSNDSGRPATSHSTHGINGYPVPIGPPPQR
jgi:hypothetical protein